MMRGFIAAAAMFVLLAAPTSALAHCDTLDGPVANDVRAALDSKDLALVLKWISDSQAPELKEAFNTSIKAAEMGGAAQELASRYFMETTIRLHRASEDEPYTGVKPAGTKQSPAVAAADKALETGSVDGLAALIKDAAEHGLHERFLRAQKAAAHAGESVDAGRGYVKAYVEFVHYAERLYADTAGGNMHGHAEDKYHED